MVRIALLFATAALVATAVPSPGLYAAIGLGIAAIGTGWIGFRTRTSPGTRRLASAAAMTLGGTALALGVIRVAIVLAAIGHVERMLG